MNSNHDKFVIFNYPFGDNAHRVKGNPLYIGYKDLNIYGASWNTPGSINLPTEQVNVIWNSGILVPICIIN